MRARTNQSETLRNCLGTRQTFPAESLPGAPPSLSCASRPKKDSRCYAQLPTACERSPKTRTRHWQRLTAFASKVQSQERPSPGLHVIHEAVSAPHRMRRRPKGLETVGERLESRKQTRICKRVILGTIEPRYQLRDQSFHEPYWATGSETQ